MKIEREVEKAQLSEEGKIQSTGCRVVMETRSISRRCCAHSSIQALINQRGLARNLLGRYKKERASERRAWRELELSEMYSNFVAHHWS